MRLPWGPICALLAAAQGGHAEVPLTLLREHGADVEANSMPGETPLMSAAAGGHTEAVNLLCEHGARWPCCEFCCEFHATLCSDQAPEIRHRCAEHRGNATFSRI
ncbi:MAG: ankyrin repeat domain-containing protein [Gemmatimonadota bacterium]|nr:MAG: ankyrin repeat domain-containing protein [Gemmatimonadota bacterium]